MKEEGQSQRPWHKLPVKWEPVFGWGHTWREQRRQDCWGGVGDSRSCRGTAVVHECGAANSEASGGLGREVLVSSAGQRATLLEFFPMPCFSVINSEQLKLFLPSRLQECSCEINPLVFSRDMESTISNSYNIGSNCRKVKENLRLCTVWIKCKSTASNCKSQSWGGGGVSKYFLQNPYMISFFSLPHLF